MMRRLFCYRSPPRDAEAGLDWLRADPEEGCADDGTWAILLCAQRARRDQDASILSGMGGRVVYGSGLENRRGFTPTVGSNPTPSARSSLRLRHP